MILLPVIWAMTLAQDIYDQTLVPYVGQSLHYPLIVGSVLSLLVFAVEFIDEKK